MAPIAIEPQNPEAALSLGQYKEQVPGPKAYQKKVELEGTEGHPAAKVRVPYRRSCQVQMTDTGTLNSTSTIFRRGIPTRNMLLLSLSHM